MLQILVICAESPTREVIAAAVGRCRRSAICCSTVGGARTLLGQGGFSVVFCEDLLPDGAFQDVLEIIADLRMSALLIVLSRRDDWGAYLSTLAAGAFDYIVCPPSSAETERILRMALATPSQGTLVTQSVP